MTAEQIVAQVEDLPVVSETAQKFLGLINQPHLHNDELVSTLLYDQVLTAKMLRACNSAQAGLSQEVTSVEQAVAILGHQKIFRLVAMLSFGGVMSGGLPGYAVEAGGLWNHCLGTAFAAEHLAANEFQGKFPPATAFTAALLHDIGKLVLDQLLTPKARLAVRTSIANAGNSRTEAEKEVFGADHSEVGACLLRRWRLPEVIVEAVANHHTPVSQPLPQLSAVVHLANCVAHLIGSAPGWDAYAVRLDKSTSQMFGLQPERLQLLMIGVQESLGRVDQFMAAA